MKEVKFLVDLGSTFTKVVVVDLASEKVICRVQGPSTVDTDVMIGLREAIQKAKSEAGITSIDREDVLASSSAAGGLRMVCIGLVPDLSLKAGTEAALGAGAKLVGSYSYELTKDEMAEIEAISPEVILLAGGTDGGNESVVLHNAKMLASSKINAVIVVACNKGAQDRVRSILENGGKKVKLAKNVMPEIGKIEVSSCREAIRDVFVKNIVRAKGIERVKEMVKEVLMPTPQAVLNAAKLLSEGVNGEEGLGELMVVDVGGATTDVHSIAEGKVTQDAIYGDLLPEPLVKRTVEGDLGVRHNIDTLLKIGREKGFLDDHDLDVAGSLSRVNKLPKTPEERRLDMKLARIATQVAVERHVGRIEDWYGPAGRMIVQRGKDLRGINSLIGTGGPIVFAQDPRSVLEGALFDRKRPNLLKPESPRLYLDGDYILYAIGILANLEPEKALRIAKKYLKEI